MNTHTAPQHDHMDERLYVGCPGCIAQVKHDQFTSALSDMDVDDLVDMMMGAGPKAELAEAELKRRWPGGNGIIEVTA